jgi:hypothetical protein
MTYGDVAEAAWAWVRNQVQWDDDGPWIPEAAGGDKPVEYIDGMHSGIGGLAYTLAEIRLTRPWTSAEQDLATGIADRIRALVPKDRSTTFFDGEVSSIGILSALEEPGTDAALQRIRDLATDDGWPESFLDEPRYEPGAFANDVTLGTSAVLLGAVWAMRRGSDALGRPRAG